MLASGETQQMRRPVGRPGALRQSQRKLALPLWIKLQHAAPDQPFDILLTLGHEPDRSELQQLEACGLQMNRFYRDHPTRLLPGLISRHDLESGLLEQCGFVTYVEGVIHVDPGQEMETVAS